MPEIIYRIRFTDVRGKVEDMAGEGYLYHSRSLAEMAAGSLNHTNNPAWNGVFSVVEREAS